MFVAFLIDLHGDLGPVFVGEKSEKVLEHLQEYVTELGVNLEPSHILELITNCKVEYPGLGILYCGATE
jgi:hypothetical protein